MVVTLAAVSARLVAPGEAHVARPTRALMCGSQRWIVKTLQDKPHLISVKPNTVAHLTSLPRPKPAPVVRGPFERHIYSVEGSVTAVLMEADQDLHIVLEDGPAHMVVEPPNAPLCTVNATAYRRKQMVNA